VAEALTDPGLTWRPVSPKLLVVRRIGLMASVVPLTVLTATVALAVGGTSAAAVVALVWLLVLGLGWRLTAANYRAWGYAERDQDLLVRRGVLVRRLSVVPYGRMQFVDVTAGPLDRRLGIASVVMHTAAAASDARIPGLPAAEAARLRDRLAALGEARAAGL